MTVHSVTDLEKIWTDAGGNPVYAPVAAAFSLAESGGDDQAVSPSNDWGLWQINGGGRALLDPTANAKAAIAKSNNGTDWRYWTTAYAGGPQGVIRGGGYVGPANRNYLASGAAFWAHLPAGATLPPGAGTTGGIAGTAGTAGAAAGTAGSSGGGGAAVQAVASSGGCQIKTGKVDLKLFTLGPWCLDGTAGVLVMGAGVTVMLIGTVVVLSRFGATRQIAASALQAVPGGSAVRSGARAAGAATGGAGGGSEGRSRQRFSGPLEPRQTRRERREQTVREASAADRRFAGAGTGGRPGRGFGDDRPSDVEGGPPPPRPRRQRVGGRQVVGRSVAA